MTRRIPTVSNGTLHEHIVEVPSTDTIVVGSNAWYTWLENHSTFRFDHPSSSFTARKEQRSGGWYWYAYRRHAGRLHTAYVGRSAELSITRLEVIAAELAGVNDTQGLHMSAGDHVPVPHTSILSQQEVELIPRNNLPLQLTSFVGREQDITVITALMRRPAVRLLTLTGTAGVGKTRLGLQAATELTNDFVDGVCFVSLAPFRDPDLVLPAVAQALKLPEARGRSPLQYLQAALREQHLLLLLDNFEQVAAAAPFLVALLQSCPNLKIIVTSRASLRVRGAYEVQVSPLYLPDPSLRVDLETLAHNASVTLFIQRAQALVLDFTLTETNAHIVAEICGHLDGLPLAIELAAARIKLLSPHQLLSRLEHRLEILTGGAQDLPVRQRTIRSTLQWSYDLLSPGEQQLFQLLSVFDGGCMVEAVEAQWRVLGNDVTAVLDGLQRLLDNNLIFESKQPNGKMRLMMLETIREYGQECLEKSGEEAIVREAHAAYYLAFTEEAEPHLLHAEQVQWLDQLEGEHENLRAALQWFLTTPKSEQGLRMSGALWYFWGLRHLVEGQNWYEQVLAIGKEDITEARAKALHGASIIAYFQGNYSRATELVEASLKIARMLRDKRRIALSLNTRGQIALITADYATMRTMIEECVPLHREMVDHFWLAMGLYLSAYHFQVSGDQVRASSVAEEALAVHRKVGEPITMVRTLHALAYFAYTQRDFESAYGYYEESLQISIAIGDKPLMTTCLIGLGTIAAAQGQMAWAAQLWGATTGTTLTEDLGIYDWYTNILSAQIDYQRWSAHVRTGLGEEAFKKAWEEGRATTLEQLLLTRGNRSFVQPSSDEEATLSKMPSPTSPVKLTHRERDVLRLLAQGLTSAQIAEKLVIGVVTVNFHVRSIYNKVGVSSRSAATRYAMEHHLI